MDRLLRLGTGMPGLGGGGAPSDAPVVDTAEQVYISSLALLKVCKFLVTQMPVLARNHILHSRNDYHCI